MSSSEMVMADDGTTRAVTSGWTRTTNSGATEERSSGISSRGYGGPSRARNGRKGRMSITSDGE